MNTLTTLLLVWLVAATVQAGGWLWQRRRSNAGIVDVLWAGLVGLSAVLVAGLGPGAVLPRTLLALCGGLWGLRLGWHLWKRVRGEPEDGRYAYLRQHWGVDQRKWFVFFQAQALLVVLFALPFVAVAANPVVHLSGWFVAGAVVWLASVIGEAVADAQLARFRSNPVNRGRTCRDGLWGRSRHPNYFFEWLHWCAYACFAIGSPLWWLALAGPVLMYVFVRWISGVPYTEAQALRTRGDDYRAYQRDTPMLFPRLFRRLPRSKS